MNLQPTIIGKQVKLEPLLPSDMESLYLAANDPLIWEQHPNSDRHQRPEFEKFFQKALDSKGALKIIDQNNGRVIGTCRYYDFDSQKKSVSVGYLFLERFYWGQRFNEETLYLMLTYIFRFVETVIFEIGEKNIRSQMAAKKIGASFVKKSILDGGPHVVFQIKESDLSTLKKLLGI
jgi:RimJ/RimL family protein N-acetyltransferase